MNLLPDGFIRLLWIGKYGWSVHDLTEDSNKNKDIIKELLLSLVDILEPAS